MWLAVLMGADMGRFGHFVKPKYLPILLIITYGGKF